MRFAGWVRVRVRVRVMVRVRVVPSKNFDCDLLDGVGFEGWREKAAGWGTGGRVGVKECVSSRGKG